MECLFAALDAPTIHRMDCLLEKYFEQAQKAHPNDDRRQDLFLRARIIEDCPADEAAVVAMQADHYLLCLRINSQALS
jgi:hypothetical protein